MKESQLFEPILLKCGQVVRNRIWLAPLTNKQSHDDGRLSTEERLWLKKRAEGGFGGIITCATYIDQSGKTWEGELGLADDSHTQSLQDLARDIHASSATGIVQIFHGGFRAPSAITGQQPVSVSEFSLDTPGFEKPRALTEDEIFTLINKYASAARRAVAAGMAGVEVHGANGYLITQFLSNTLNQRKDRWGQSLENRSRFLLEILKECRKAMGPNAILGIRISPENTKIVSGILIDEMLELTTELIKAGVDYIHLSLWNSRKLSEEYKESRGPVIQQFSEKIKKQIPLLVAGKIWTAQEALDTINLGADVITLGFAGIANPDWPRQVMLEGLSFQPKRFPLTKSELHARAVSDKFINYLSQWPGLELVRD